MFKIGVGPSSSHTLGPWRAAQRFTDSIETRFGLGGLKNVKVLLYGSLAKTGKGHGTDIAIQLGLAGEDPVTFDVSQIDPTIASIATDKKINIRGSQPIFHWRRIRQKRRGGDKLRLGYSIALSDRYECRPSSLVQKNGHEHQRSGNGK